MEETGQVVGVCLEEKGIIIFVREEEGEVRGGPGAAIGMGSFQHKGKKTRKAKRETQKN